MTDHPLEYQIGGTHYQEHGDYQPWAVLRKWLTAEQMIGYLLGSSVSYLARFNSRVPGKGDLEDIQKARHTLGYLEQILLEADPPPQELGTYYAHATADGQPCTVQYRQDGRAFIRLTSGGGGFWVQAEKLLRGDARRAELRPEEVTP